MDHDGRIAKTISKLDAAEVDALLVTDLTNVRYLTGFSGTNGQVLVTPDAAIFLSDPRYEARAADLVHGAEVVIYRNRLTDQLGPRLGALGITRLGVEDSMTIASSQELGERLTGIELLPRKGIVEGLRRSKEPAELATIEAAVAVADAAFEWVLGRLETGTTEKDVALDLEVRMRKTGAEDVSFEPIVGSGPLSAHIHHTPSKRQFEKGDLVLLDLGARVDGYCSDLTRTVVLGPATDDQRARYETVLAAQEVGIAAATVGSPGAEVDAYARAVVEEAGFGDAFGHGLGHGVGLDIHEAPRLHRISEDELVDGDVVTVEPGIYAADDGGIRIEDCVSVTAAGPRALSRAPKDTLLEL